MLTPYQFASNTPIQAIDLDGLEALKIVNVQYNDDNTAYITITADDDVWNNYSSKFQLKLPDGKVYNDWTVEGLKNQFESFKRENGGFVLNGKDISSHRALTAQKTNPDNGNMEAVGQKMNDFLYIVKVNMKDLNYKSITKKGAKRLIADTPLDKLDGSGLDKLIENIGGKSIGYNRLDVYVPDEQKEAFLNLAKDAKIEARINFVPQVNKGTTYEILPIKEETKKLEETE